jgi:hypothetical protein
MPDFKRTHSNNLSAHQLIDFKIPTAEIRCVKRDNESAQH